MALTTRYLQYRQFFHELIRAKMGLMTIRYRKIEKTWRMKLIVMSQTMSIMLLAPGPVRQLQCTYDTLREKAFLCEWEAPYNPHGDIKFYNVNITLNGTTVLTQTTKSPRFNSTIQMKHGDAYTVSVSAVTYKEGEAASTNVIFNNSGKPTSLYC